MKNISTLIFRALLLVCTSGFGDDPCISPNIVTIARPVYPLETNSPAFQYKFEYRMPSDKSHPTIVFLPGGPGGSSVGSEKGQIPGEYGLILTDPRGVGCNRLPRKDDSRFYTTRNLAEDIVSVIESQKLDNYIIYGHSYGTILGTVVSSLLEDRGLPLPKAVVLEGVFGNATYDVGEVVAPKARVWEETKLMLSKSSRLEVSKTKPLGIDSSRWGFFITAILGGYGSNALVQLLESLKEPEGSEKLEGLRKRILSLEIPKAEQDPDKFSLWQHITCRELAETMPGYAFDVILERGELVAAPSDYCADFKLSTPYRPRDWQIPVEAYYFVGDKDPATPLDSGLTHFNSQFKAKKHFALVSGGGHSPLKFNLADCAQTIFRAIAFGEGLAGEVKKCSTVPQIFSE